MDILVFEREPVFQLVVLNENKCFSQERRQLVSLSLFVLLPLLLHPFHFRFLLVAIVHLFCVIVPILLLFRGGFEEIERRLAQKNELNKENPRGKQEKSHFHRSAN